MKILEKIKRIFSRQRVFCYCPGCKKDLIGGKKTSIDEIKDRGHTIYILGCSKCGTKSHWLFDAPVPMLVDIEKGDKNEKEN